MKKLFLIVSLYFLSTMSFAQSKGDQHISMTLGFELGTQKNRTWSWLNIFVKIEGAASNGVAVVNCNDFVIRR